MLRLKAQQFENEVNEIKEAYGKYFMSTMSIDMLIDTDPEIMKLLGKSWNLMDTSLELVLEQAKMLDEIDRKLDMIDRKLDMLLAKS